MVRAYFNLIGYKYQAPTVAKCGLNQLLIILKNPTVILNLIQNLRIAGQARNDDKRAISLLMKFTIDKEM